MIRVLNHSQSFREQPVKISVPYYKYCVTKIYVIIKKIFIEIMNKKIRMLNHSQKFM